MTATETETAPAEAGPVVVSAGLDLTINHAAAFREKSLRAIADPGEPPAGVVIDLAATQLLDTVGLAAVVAACRTAKSRDVPFTVTGATGHVLKHFQIAGLTGLLNVQETADA